MQEEWKRFFKTLYNTTPVVPTRIFYSEEDSAMTDLDELDLSILLRRVVDFFSYEFFPSFQWFIHANKWSIWSDVRPFEQVVSLEDGPAEYIRAVQKAIHLPGHTNPGMPS